MGEKDRARNMRQRTEEVGGRRDIKENRANM